MNEHAPEPYGVVPPWAGDPTTVPAYRQCRCGCHSPEPINETLLAALEAASDSVDEDYFLKPAILSKIRAAIALARGDQS